MITVESIKCKVMNATKVAIICHVSPDCDTMGAGFALAQFLNNLGKSADVYCDDKYEKLNFLTDYESFGADEESDVYDLAIGVDTATGERMGDVRQHYYRAKDRFVIDHHKSNEFNSEELYLVSDASSTCEIMYSILEFIDVNAIDRQIAQLLYAGILTDSGAFYHPTTSANTHKVLALLYGYGIDSNKIYYELFKKIAKNTFELHSLALSKAKFYKDARVGVISFLREDFEKTATDEISTEGCINKILDVDGVDIAISIAEVSEDYFKVSFRSKGEIDVSYCAGRFGGGGHRNASGCRLHGNYYEVLDRLLAVVDSVL